VTGKIGNKINTKYGDHITKVFLPLHGLNRFHNRDTFLVH